MSERFDYPTAAAPTASLIFGTAAHLIDDPDELSFNDSVGVTFGGTDRAADFGDTKNTYTYSFILPRSSVTEHDKADAITFFQTVRRIYTFQWTDADATVRTVRLMTNPVRFSPVENNSTHVRCTIELREQ